LRFGSLFLWLFGGVLGKRRTNGFLRAELYLFKIPSSIFLRILCDWSQVLDWGMEVSFLDFVDKIMHGNLRA